MKPMIRRLRLLEQAYQVEEYVEREDSPAAILRARRDEALFDNKGLLFCRVELGKIEKLGIVNIHTTAGGFWTHPEAPKS
jgi:hypothetical protein